eukprot:TRINITY_DN4212_c0_g1_i1.p1 TRINITY_DN4212_c0_g1~~TRINITY_DN4212_c0_g1_i1.p1  ORF type:complete len:612 (+),score=53.56 TRINITY_DN4212_c0_g1_i1:623-2458(+)
MRFECLPKAALNAVHSFLLPRDRQALRRTSRPVYVALPPGRLVLNLVNNVELLLTQLKEVQTLELKWWGTWTTSVTLHVDRFGAQAVTGASVLWVLLGVQCPAVTEAELAWADPRGCQPQDEPFLRSLAECVTTTWPSLVRFANVGGAAWPAGIVAAIASRLPQLRAFDSLYAVAPLDALAQHCPRLERLSLTHSVASPSPAKRAFSALCSTCTALEQLTLRGDVAKGNLGLILQLPKLRRLEFWHPSYDMVVALARAAKAGQVSPEVEVHLATADARGLVQKVAEGCPKLRGLGLHATALSLDELTALENLATSGGGLDWLDVRGASANSTSASDDATVVEIASESGIQLTSVRVLTLEWGSAASRGLLRLCPMVTALKADHVCPQALAEVASSGHLRMLRSLELDNFRLAAAIETGFEAGNDNPAGLTDQDLEMYATVARALLRACPDLNFLRIQQSGECPGLPPFFAALAAEATARQRPLHVVLNAPRGHLPAVALGSPKVRFVEISAAFDDAAAEALVSNRDGATSVEYLRPTLVTSNILRRLCAGLPNLTRLSLSGSTDLPSLVLESIALHGFALRWLHAFPFVKATVDHEAVTTLRKKCPWVLVV